MGYRILTFHLLTISSSQNTGVVSVYILTYTVTYNHVTQHKPFRFFSQYTKLTYSDDNIYIFIIYTILSIIIGLLRSTRSRYFGESEKIGKVAGHP